jgi:hypothetical protein
MSIKLIIVFTLNQIVEIFLNKSYVPYFSLHIKFYLSSYGYTVLCWALAVLQFLNRIQSR